MPTVSRAKMERALPIRDPRPNGTAQRFSIERQMPSGKTADRQHSVAKTAKLATVSPVPIVCAVKLQLREDDEACTKTPNVPSSLSTSASSTPRYHPSTPPSPGSAAFGLPNKSFGREFHAQRKLRMGEDAGRTKLQRGSKADKIVPEGMVAFYPEKREPKKRCAWITSQSDAAYVSYHDEEWGVPLHDDKLFELLVLGGAQAEISWSTILSKREVYRDAFAAFDPAVLATYDDEAKLATLKTQGDVMRSDARIESVVNNAKLVLKIAEEFGSFGHYLWSFLNYKPIGNSYRHPNFIPVKNAKSEAISKDLQKRGLRHAGPMVVYSLMQAAGMTNDHLVNCFRYKECKILQEQQQQHHQHEQQQQRQLQMISSKVQGENQLQARRKPHKPFASSPVCF